MKLILAAITSLLITSISFGAVVKTSDYERDCDLYQTIKEDQQGKVKLLPGQQLVSSKSIYGLSFKNMSVDFDRREVLVEPIMNIVLGLDRPLIDRKVIIKEDNTDFSFLTNQLNRSIALFEKVCINKDFEVVYADFFKQQK